MSDASIPSNQQLSRLARSNAYLGMDRDELREIILDRDEEIERLTRERDEARQDCLNFKLHGNIAGRPGDETSGSRTGVMLCVHCGKENRVAVEPKPRREYHANGTYWSGVPTVDMPCDFCALPITGHNPRTHACPPENGSEEQT